MIRIEQKDNARGKAGLELLADFLKDWRYKCLLVIVVKEVTE